MKVVHLNTGVNRTSAPFRLHEALGRAGVVSDILVLNEGAELPGVRQVSRSFWYKCKRKAAAFWRAECLKRYRPMAFMPFTALPIGMNVTKNPAVKEADVIFLHWVCGDFMSPDTIRRLLRTGKPVFAVCHDNYPFTGGCHVRLGCRYFEKNCGCCPQLHSDKEKDLTSRLLERKKSFQKFSNLYVCSPSRWMDANAAKSTVFAGKRHFVLPNAIDTEVFYPYERKTVREAWGFAPESLVILAGLKANAKIPYNGTEYLRKVFEKLQEHCTEGKWNGRRVEIAVFGVKETEQEKAGGFPIRNLGFIGEAKMLAKLYAAADVYLITSLEDSFNQTAAECMACGTPVAAFQNGGIADIIDHKKNGYLAEYKNEEDLTKGLLWAAEYADRKEARRKICECFSYEKVSGRFLEIADEVLAEVKQGEQESNS